MGLFLVSFAALRSRDPQAPWGALGGPLAARWRAGVESPPPGTSDMAGTGAGVEPSQNSH
jgi:hypothetical protein